MPDDDDAPVVPSPSTGPANGVRSATVDTNIKTAINQSRTAIDRSYRILATSRKASPSED